MWAVLLDRAAWATEWDTWVGCGMICPLPDTELPAAWNEPKWTVDQLSSTQWHPTTTAPSLYFCSSSDCDWLIARNKSHNLGKYVESNWYSRGVTEHSHDYLLCVHRLVAWHGCLGRMCLFCHAALHGWGVNGMQGSVREGYELQEHLWEEVWKVKFTVVILTSLLVCQNLTPS